MAFDAGAIVASIKLDDTQFSQAVKRSGDTTAKMQERIQRLESILSRVKLGSDRFKNLSKTLEQTKRDFDLVSGRANVLNKTLSTLGSAVSAGAIITGLKGFSKEAANFQSTTVAFNVMLGSAEKASQMLQKLNKFSLTTPFSPDQVNQAAKALLSFGFTADEVTENLNSLGNISAGTGKDFAELAIIFGQIRASGRLLGGDLMQLINAGFNPLEVMATKTGKSMAVLKEEMSKGLISFDMVKEAFDAAAGAGGRFDSMMEKQAETMNGLASTIEGNSQEISKNFGMIINEALEPLMRGFLSLQNTVLNFTKDSPQTARAIMQITLALSGVLALILGTNGLISALNIIRSIAPLVGASFSTMLGPIGLFAAAVTALISSILIAKARIQDLRTEQQKTNLTFAELGKAINPKGYEEATSLISKYQGEVKLTKEEFKDFTKTLADAGIGVKGLIGRFDDGGNSVVLNKLKMQELQKQIVDLGKKAEETPAPFPKMPKSTLNIEANTEALKENSRAYKTVEQKAQEALNKVQNEFSQFANDINSIMKSVNNYFGAPFKTLSKEAQAGFAAVGKVAQLGAEMMQSSMQLAMAKIQRSMQRFDLASNVILGRMQKQHEAELKFAEDASKAELEFARNTEQEKLRLFELSENAKIDALKKAQIEQAALRDKELQDELARLEKEKKAFLEQERVKFNARQRELLSTAETQAQQRIIKESNEQDWLAFAEMTNRKYLEKQSEATRTARDREKVETENAKAFIVEQETLTAQTIEAERQASNERMATKEAEQAKKLQEIKERQEKEKRDSEKKSALIRYTMELAGMKVSQQMQKMQAGMQYAAGLMNVATMVTGLASATLGLGLIPAMALGATMTAILTKTYANSIATIGMQSVSPPAELFLKDGGLIGGRRHSNGGTSMGLGIEAERRELFIDRGRTERLFNWMDQGMGGGGGVTVNINAGAFQGVGDLSDNSIQIISERIGREIERRAY